MAKKLYLFPSEVPNLGVTGVTTQHNIPISRVTRVTKQNRSVNMPLTIG